GGGRPRPPVGRRWAARAPGGGGGGLRRRVMDREGSARSPPPGADAPRAGSAPSPAASAAERPAGYGMANYERIFRSRRDGGDTRPDTKVSAWVDLLERAGIVRALPFGASNDEVAELLRDYPDRFIGLARISALHGMRR